MLLEILEIIFGGFIVGLASSVTVCLNRIELYLSLKQCIKLSDKFAIYLLKESLMRLSSYYILWIIMIMKY